MEKVLIFPDYLREVDQDFFGFYDNKKTEIINNFSKYILEFIKERKLNIRNKFSDDPHYFEYIRELDDYQDKLISRILQFKERMFLQPMPPNVGGGYQFDDSVPHISGYLSPELEDSEMIIINKNALLQQYVVDPQQAGNWFEYVLSHELVHAVFGIMDEGLTEEITQEITPVRFRSSHEYRLQQMAVSSLLGEASVEQLMLINRQKDPLTKLLYIINMVNQGEMLSESEWLNINSDKNRGDYLSYYKDFVSKYFSANWGLFSTAFPRLINSFNSKEFSVDMETNFGVNEFLVNFNEQIDKAYSAYTGEVNQEVLKAA